MTVYLFGGLLAGLFLAYMALILAAALSNCYSYWKKDRNEPSYDQLHAQTPDIVVTLVHGTWARRNKWIHSDSAFSQVLRSQLSPTVAITNEFRWSGRNSVSARHRAGEELRVHMKRLIFKWPNSSHFIVGHSHGGTVAFKALDDKNLNSRIDGVVTLSTPFILHQRRAQNIFLIVALRIAPLILFWLVLPLLLSATIFKGSDFPEWLSVFGIMFGIIALVFGPKHYEKMATLLAERLSLPQVANDKVLILRGTMDEALLSLNAAQAISFGVNAIYSFPAHLLSQAIKRISIWQRLLRRYERFLDIFLPSTWLLSLGFAAFHGSQSNFGIYVVVTTTICMLYMSVISHGGLGTIILGGMLLGAATVPLLVMLSVLALPLGYELALAAVLLQVSAEPTPNGKWTVWHWHPSISLSPHDRLSHSALYGDMSALSEIVSFMVSRSGHNAT